MTASTDWKALARRAFDAALAAGHPAGVTAAAMKNLPADPTAVIAVGKAAAAMATAVRDAAATRRASLSPRTRAMPTFPA